MKKRKRKFFGPFQPNFYGSPQTRSCCPKFSKLITKAAQGQQNERSVYDVAFRKTKIVKS